VGDESIPRAAQPPGLIPSEPPRAGCPINPRPRNRRAYEAACMAAEGERVTEYNAFEIEEGMLAWCGGAFLAVTNAKIMRLGDFEEMRKQFTESTLAHQFVLLRLQGRGATTGWIIGDLDTPVYVLAPTPGAATAPGAGASVQELTTVQR